MKFAPLAKRTQDRPQRSNAIISVWQLGAEQGQLMLMESSRTNQGATVDKGQQTGEFLFSVTNAIKYNFGNEYPNRCSSSETICRYPERPVVNITNIQSILKTTLYWRWRAKSN